MKRLLLRLFYFAIILIIVDQVGGKIFDYMNEHQKGGYIQQLNYALNESHEDILIFGSSRCYNHYVPRIISDSLGMSCYNCGYEGEGILFHYGRIRKILNRYKPKLIIYDVEPYFDYLGADDEKYLKHLMPFVSSDTSIANYFKEISPMEYLKTRSKLYCYNTKFTDVIKGYMGGIKTRRMAMCQLKVNWTQMRYQQKSILVRMLPIR